MSNGYFNGQTRTSLGAGGGKTSPGSKAGKGIGFAEKPGFKTGVPGKKQSKDRSAGVPRAKVNPQSEGL